MGELVFAVCIVLFMSAVCSGAEAALLSVPLVKVKKQASSQKQNAKILLSIREKINRPITTIVTLNNIANIGGSIYVGAIATSTLGNGWLGTFTGVLTFLIIVFGEIIPKTIGENYALSISLFAAKPILYLTKLLTPLVWCIEIITTPFISKEKRKTTDESEIKYLAYIGKKEGVIEHRESEMIHKVFEFNDITAENIMTPRVAMTYININDKLSEIQEKIINSQHSRIIVIRESIDDVAGVVIKSVLLSAIIHGKGNEPVANFVSEVQFVAETAKTNNLLEAFQKNEQHLIVVVDEYGGVSGVVTLEDVLEILIGEIVDETDKVADLQEFARRKHKRTFSNKK